MKTILVDGFHCQLHFSKEFRHAVLDLIAPDGMCFSGGEHFLTVDHRNGIRRDMELEMISKSTGEQLQECHCEDCRPLDWFSSLKSGDVIEAARDIAVGDVHWFADAGEMLTVTCVTNTDTGMYIGVRRQRGIRNHAVFKVVREDVRPVTNPRQ